MLLTLWRNPNLKGVGDGGKVPCQQVVEEGEEYEDDSLSPITHAIVLLDGLRSSEEKERSSRLLEVSWGDRLFSKKKKKKKTD